VIVNIAPPTARPHASQALIAFMGLPGSGKSTTAKSLSELIPGSRAYLEPEEKDWPIGVAERHKFGLFSALTWFRAMRVPLLLSAHAVRMAGGIAIVDSYYDKLIAHYIEHASMRWLLPQNDPYFGIAKQIAIIDQQILPNADVVIFLRVSELQWSALLANRGRGMDKEDEFLRSFPSQSEFLDASRSFARAAGAYLILQDQEIGSPEQTARAILQQLMKSKIVKL
jgi:thymidylate kinase